MNQNQQALDHQLQEFRKKFYLDKIIRGSLILLLLVSTILFVVLVSEGLFGFSAMARTTMVFGLGAVFLGVLGYMVIWPSLQWSQLTGGINEYDIAGMVQKFFPAINDKLVNLLQLRNASQGELAYAAIDRKASDILPVRLSSAINFRVNVRYLWYLLIPIGLFGITYLADPNLLGSSADRLRHYNQEFIPPAPFEIAIGGLPEEMVAGEEVTISASVTGNELPAELFVFIRNDAEADAQFIDYSMEQVSATEFQYTLTDVKQNFSLYIGNPEVKSATYAVVVRRRPFIKNFQASIVYPRYTGLAPEKLEANVGDFKVLKGASVTWDLEAQGDVSTVRFMVRDGQSEAFTPSEDGNRFRITRRLMEDLEYTLSLQSPDQIGNAGTVRYRVNVVQDRYPSLYVYSPNNDFLVDLDPNMPLELEIADDYGFTKMELYYRFVKSGGASEVTETFKNYPLTIDGKTLLQPLAYNIDLTGLGLSEGDELEYYLKVWDNDGVSGPKASTSATYRVIYPTLDAKYEEITAEQEEVKDDLEQLKKTSESLKDAYEKMQKKLLDQKQLSFDDKREVERMVEEHKKMIEQLKETQEQFEETKDQLQENQMISEETLEKYEELNKFMEQLDDPEIRKMLEEMQDKLENLNPEDIKEKMDQLQMNDEKLRESLERTLELLKQLEVQQKLDELRNKLDNMEAKQRVLQEKTEKAETSPEMERAAEQQETLNEQMDKLQEDMDKLGEMKSETKTPDEAKMEELSKDADEAKEEMEKAAEQAQQSGEQKKEGGRKNNKESQESQQGASQSQKKAADKMQEMSEQLSDMQMSMQGQQDQENLESLRELLENLLKLSFDQEDLRDEVKDLKYGDPALKNKSQDQKSLQDDMTLVEDSLKALANRMFMIQSFVMDESRKITENMSSSQQFFRNKQVPKVTYHQQEAMTSINNLANMLSDIMKQVQEQMKNAQGQGMCEKPGQKPGQKPGDMQGISEQQRKLNQQMKQMMQSGQMSGEKMSEMAAQQQAIRKQLEEAQQRMKGESGKALGDLDKIKQDMQESENDLVNKQLSGEMMRRQQQILQRLLQAQQSVREQGLDDKRESKTARELDKKSPEELTLEEYKNKIRQELLKSNKLEYSNDFMILIEQYYKKLEQADE
jgi:hypothetical protein